MLSANCQIRVEREPQETEGAVQHKDVDGSYQLQQQPLRQDNETRATLPQRQQVKQQTTS